MHGVEFDPNTPEYKQRQRELEQLERKRKKEQLEERPLRRGKNVRLLQLVLKKLTIFIAIVRQAFRGQMLLRALLAVGTSQQPRMWAAAHGPPGLTT